MSLSNGSFSGQHEHDRLEQLKNKFDFKRLCWELSRLPEHRRERYMADVEMKAQAEEEQPIFITTKEFSRKSGIPIHTLRRLLNKGKIRGKRFDRMWLVYTAELERLKAEGEG